MNYNKLVLDYINNCPFDEPIFIEDIKTYVKNNIGSQLNIDKIMKNINVIINRLTKKEKLNIYTRGIYYKPTKSIFGVRGLDADKIVEKKYLEEDGNINGYFTDATLFNALGLTTQIPRYRIIATNACTTNNAYNNERLCVTIKKPKIKINNDNYLYLQLLDLLANKEKINVEVSTETEKEIIYEFIKENNLEMEKIFMYANMTNNKKAIEKLYKLG